MVSPPFRYQKGRSSVRDLGMAGPFRGARLEDKGITRSPAG